MLLAIGGGFFSSSASGYSNGLTLLLGQEKGEKPMRVFPWNQYLFADKDSDPNLQLASTNNQLSGQCATFFCFSSTPSRVEKSLPPKVGRAQQAVVPGPLVSDKGKDHIPDPDDGTSLRKTVLKSSLKKPSKGVPTSIQNVDGQIAWDEKGGDILVNMERRKLQWTDACGSELVEIREFEPSETDGSDYEFENGNGRYCSCTIM